LYKRGVGIMDYINTSEIVKEDIVKKSLAHWREYL